MCAKNGKSAAGMMQLSAEMAAGGMPPAWSMYVTVNDLEATVAKVATAGGQVMQPPMDVMDAGRMAVLADPAGAAFCLWQKKESIGAEVVNEQGALTWTELMTPDPAAATKFYDAVLGWTAETAAMAMGEYTVFHQRGRQRDGDRRSHEAPDGGDPAALGHLLRRR